MILEDIVVVYVDGAPMRSFRLPRTVVEPCLKRIYGNWYLTPFKGDVGLEVNCMYHWHNQELKESYLAGCLRGSRYCMDCGDEWPEEVTGVIQMYLNGRKLKECLLPSKP